ncbi:tRNA dimethylallyltransferase-like [Uloborus diversus]|uniref:tRNA dimethylallyltransferase-like n=1 Tax=Uloborus diversus TaxID=327109 RepID=UPI0024092791|nr:tRNA dimethylallyltransferase-like [Uloborus diversus]
MGKVISSLNKKKMISYPYPPIVAVLGCTGVGKSKLGIELAKKFNGEIISADSMQVYKGLDIITNKVTQDEQKEAIHHLINVIDPPKQYTVVDFRNQALKITEKLLQEKKLPIIVGGTNYYIESVLWEVLISPQVVNTRLLHEDVDICTKKLSSPISSAEDIFSQEINFDSVQKFSGEVLHEALKRVDPVMANTIHPQDRRKIVRSLQVYQQHKSPHSEMIASQRSQNGGSSLGGPLRYQNSVMLWIQCEKEVLEKRLDERVDEMLEKGLIDELLEFHKQYNESKLLCHGTPSYTEGIFQSIGFKEFHNYLILSEEQRNTAAGQKIFKNAIEDMKVATKKYAKKQVKWIKNRFLRKPDRQVPPIYALDATDLDHWVENVLDPAVKIVESINQGSLPAQNPLPVEEAIDDVQESHYCDICQRIFVGRRIWDIHLKSKKHVKMKARLKKMKSDEEKKDTVSSL